MNSVNPSDFENTISESKEESIQKALLMVQEQQKPLFRPEISVKRITAAFFLWLSIYASLCAAIILICSHFEFSKQVCVALTVALTAVFLIIKAKAMLKNAVLLYQKFAPERLRKSCLFTPSCSEYMLLSLEKYGFIKGVIKGIGRLLRCHHPNGGEDFP